MKIKLFSILIIVLFLTFVFNATGVSAEQPPSAYDIVIMLDTSTTLDTETRNFAKQILDEPMFANSRFALVDYDYNPALKNHLTTDKQLIKTGIDQLNNTKNETCEFNFGSGSVYCFPMSNKKAIDTATYPLNVALTSTNQRLVFFIKSANAPATDFATTYVTDANNKKVLFYNMSVGTYIYSLKQISGNTNALYYHASDNSKLSEGFQTFLTHLKKYYEINRVYSPDLIVTPKVEGYDNYKIENLYGKNDYLEQNKRIIIGSPFKITADYYLNNSKISFSFDPVLKENYPEGFEPAIYMYDDTVKLMTKLGNQKIYDDKVETTLTVGSNSYIFFLINDYEVKRAETLVAIDGTSDMNLVDPSGNRKLQSKNFIRDLSADLGFGIKTQYAVMNYNDVPQTLINHTSNTSLLYNKIDSIQNGNNPEANPYDCYAYWDCAYATRPFSMGRNMLGAINGVKEDETILRLRKKFAVFVVGSDREFPNPNSLHPRENLAYYPSYETVKNTANTNNVTFYGIGLDGYRYNKSLERLSRDTNGLYCPVNSEVSIADCYKFISIHMSSKADANGYISGENAVVDLAQRDDGTIDEQSLVSDPVDTSSGALMVKKTLLRYSTPRPLELTLSYNSLLTEYDSFGYGWSDGYETKITDFDNGFMIVSWSKNKRTYFSQENGTNTYIPFKSQDYNKKIIKNIDGTYVLVLKHDEKQFFNKDGEIIRKEFGKKETLHYIYNEDRVLSSIIQVLPGMTLENGNRLDFTYTEGKITSVKDNLQREVSFEYDDNNDLIRITDANGNITKYIYDNKHRIISSIDNENIEYMKNEYDTMGRVIKQYDAKKNITTFKYEEGFYFGTLITTVTNREGKQRILYHDKNYNLITYVDELENEIFYEYDNNGNRISMTNAEGYKTIFTYDARGNILTVTDPQGRVTSMTYDLEDNLLSVTNPDGSKNINEYDVEGNLVKVTNSENQITSCIYENNLLKEMVNPNGRKISFTYERYNPKTITDAEGNTITNIYDDLGRVVESVDGEGNSTKFEYDNNDNLIKTINAMNKVFTSVYDSYNNIISRTDALGNIDTFKYDVNGNLISETRDNQTVRYEYDKEDRVVKTIDSLGASIFKVYNDAGQLIQVTDKLGNVTNYTYDKLGNIQTITEGDRESRYFYNSVGNLDMEVNPEYQHTRYMYDSMNNPIEIDKMGAGRTSFTYNSLGKVLTKTDGEYHTITYTYDENGNIKTITDPKGNVTTFDYYLNNKLKSVTNTLNYTTSYKYDKNGNLIEIKDALGNITTQEYDSLNRLVSVTNALGYTVRTEYDDLGRITGLYDAKNNKVVSTTYDKKGNPITITDALANEIKNKYDSENNLIETIDELNRINTFGYNPVGQVTSTIDAKGVQSIANYDDYKELTSFSDPNQNETTYIYNKLGLVLKETDASGNSRSYTYNMQNLLQNFTNARNQNINYQYNMVGNIRYIEDLDGYTFYEYDENDNLTSIRQEFSSKTLSMEYDALNRLTKYTDEFGNVIQYQYDALGHITKLIYPDNKEVNYTYDAVGNMITVTDWNNRTTTYSYDENNRLISTVRPNGTAEIRRYDAKGQLIELKDLNGMNEPIVSYTYTYDAVGNVISENEKVYQYDELNRLISDGTHNYSYDNVGNILTMDGFEIVSPLTIPQPITPIENSNIENNQNNTTETTNAEQNNNSNSTETLNTPVDTTQSNTGGTNQTTVSEGNVSNETSQSTNETDQSTTEQNVTETTPVEENNSNNANTETNGQPIETVSEDQTSNENGTTVEQTTPVENNENVTTENTIPVQDTNNNTVPVIQEETLNNPIEQLNALLTPTTDGILDMLYGADNRLISYEGQTLDTDADGNLLNIPLNGQVLNGVYDQRNRLLQIGDTTYGYNAQNLRTSITENGVTKRFVVNPNTRLDQILMETDDQGNPIAYYVYGVGLLYKESATGDTNYYHYDRRGSTVALTDEQGTITDTYSYDAYGEILDKQGTTENNFLYNGKYGVVTDNNGLYYMRTRYYNPYIKRFINRDVIQGNLIESQTLNRFAYVNGNPVSYLDPFGMSKEYDTTKLHFWLDMGGLTPGIGIVADYANTILYLLEKDYTNALISGAAMLPAVGGYVTAAKLGGKPLLKAAIKNIDKLDEVIPVISKNIDKVDDTASAIVKKVDDLGETVSKKIEPIGPGCFLVGTLVLTDKGNKPIEEIQVGDKVLSKDENTGETTYKTVTQLSRRYKEESYIVKVGKEEIKTTEEHPFWVKDKGWVETEDLKTGDILTTNDGQNIPVSDIIVVKGRVAVYNFTVEDFHTYFVSYLGIFVHNNGGCQVTQITNSSERVLSKEDTIATIKSIRRNVQKTMKSNPVAQKYLNEGKDNLYGTYFHNKVFKKLKSLNIKDLEIDKTIIKPDTLGGKGNMRRPDFQWKKDTSEYEIWDLKPNGYDIYKSNQFKDIEQWTGVKPIPFFYNK